MRFVLLGAGSVGQRHFRNVLGLGQDIAAVCDPSPAALETVKQYGLGALLSAEESEALAQDADAALICSPTACHLRQARMAVHHGLHVFIEKPLAHTLEGTDAFVAEAAAAGRVTMVGFNLRFFPSLQLVKRLLDEGRIGRVLSARAQCGYYLPYWRPNADYRAGYGAEAAWGGIILDSIHELDYMSWLLGRPEEVFCCAGKVSTLEIHAEDNADILLRFRSGVVATVHLDYLQRTYRRSCELIGEDGVIIWDYIARSVTLYGKQDRHCELFQENINYELNQMYVEELKHFVRCIQGEEQPAVDAAQGREVLQIALAARASAARKATVTIDR